MHISGILAAQSLDLEPAVFDPLDLHVAVVQHSGCDGIAGAGAGAHIHHVADGFAVGKIGVAVLQLFDVFAGYVTHVAADHDLRPAVFGFGDGDLGPLGDHGQDLGIGIGFFAQIQAVGLDFSERNAVHAVFIGKARHRQQHGKSRDQREDQRDMSQKSGLHILCVLSENRERGDYFAASALSSQTEATSIAVYRPSFSVFLITRSR